MSFALSYDERDRACPHLVKEAERTRVFYWIVLFCKKTEIKALPSWLTIFLKVQILMIKLYIRFQHTDFEEVANLFC